MSKLGSKTKVSWQQFLKVVGSKTYERTEKGMTHQLVASLDGPDPVFTDPATGKRYGTPSAHRGHVFSFKTSNTYDTYRTLDGLGTMRSDLGLPPGAPR